MKNKGFLVTLVGLLLLIAMTGTVYWKSHLSNELPADLYKQLRCDRVTDEFLTSDKYCHDYSLYKKDHAAGII
jgi:hypothetical protein